MVTSGRIVVTFNTETAELTVISRRGHVQDVCATLAADAGGMTGGLLMKGW